MRYRHSLDGNRALVDGIRQIFESGDYLNFLAFMEAKSSDAAV